MNNIRQPNISLRMKLNCMTGSFHNFSFLSTRFKRHIILWMTADTGKWRAGSFEPPQLRPNKQAFRFQTLTRYASHLLNRLSGQYCTLVAVLVSSSTLSICGNLVAQSFIGRLTAHIVRKPYGASASAGLVTPKAISSVCVTSSVTCKITLHAEGICYRRILPRFTKRLFCLSGLLSVMRI
jgi:hypothetical protein